MDNFTTLDFIVIILYLLAMLVIGFAFTKKVKTAEDFFVGGRSIGFFPMLATVCATIIGGGALIGRGGVIYDQGLVGVWPALPYFVGMLAFSFISHRINHIGVEYNISSIPELMEKRFGKSVKMIFAALIGYTMMATVGSQISATATVIQLVGSSWNISYELGAIIATIIFIIYTSASGLFGVIYTDVAQFLVLLVMVYITLPIMILSKTGGVENLLAQLPDGMLSARPDSTIVGYIFTNLLFSFAGAEMWQRAFASRNKKIASRGMFWGTFTYGITIFITLLVSLGARVLVPDLLNFAASSDAAIPALIIRILPAGLTGLAIAGLLAVMMSSSDSYLLISAQTFLQDIVGSIKKDFTVEQELKWSRILTPILGFTAMIIALYIHSAYAALMFAWTFYAASVGVPAFAALFWKKATKAGIISSVSAGFVVSIAWKILGAPFGIAEALAGGVACIIALVVVSLITYPKKEYPLLVAHEGKDVKPVSE